MIIHSLLPTLKPFSNQPSPVFTSLKMTKKGFQWHLFIGWHLSLMSVFILIFHLTWIIFGILSFYPYHIETHFKFIKWAFYPFDTKFIQTGEPWPKQHEYATYARYLLFPVLLAVLCGQAMLLLVHMAALWAMVIIMFCFSKEAADTLYLVGFAYVGLVYGAPDMTKDMLLFSHKVRWVRLDDCDEMKDKIKAVGHSGHHKDNEIDSIFYDDPYYSWWDVTNQGRDIWMTFDTETCQISKISITFATQRHANRVIVYTKEKRGGQWSEWGKLADGNNVVDNTVIIDINEDHEKFVKLRFEDFVDDYITVQRIKFELTTVNRAKYVYKSHVEPREVIQAIACSSTYRGGYEKNNIYYDNVSYWRSDSYCRDVWMTFDCHKNQLSKLILTFNKEYKSNKVIVYTQGNNTNDSFYDWNKWTQIAEVYDVNADDTMTVPIKYDHERFVRLRFSDFTNEHVGLQRFKFELIDGIRPDIPPNEEIRAVSSSGTFKGYSFEPMYNDDDKYWRSTENCSDVWLAFDTMKHQITKLSMLFNAEYIASKVLVYSKSTKGGGWNEWKQVAEGNINVDENRMNVYFGENKHDTFLRFRFFNWTNGYVGIQRIKFEVRETEPRINAVASSGSFDKCPLDAMYEDGDEYWRSKTNAEDIWITFDCERKSVSKITLKFKSKYYAKKVFVYTNATRPFNWNQGTFIKEVGLSDKGDENCKFMMDINLASHDKFVCLRFFDWMNGHVGIKRVNFEFNGSIPGMNNDEIASAPTMDFDEEEGNVTGGGIIEEEQQQPGGKDDYIAIDVTEWNLGDWLKGIDGVYFDDYFDIFVDNGFDSKKCVASMTDDDLMQIGIKKLGHRKMFNNAIQNMGGAVTNF